MIIEQKPTQHEFNLVLSLDELQRIVEDYRLINKEGFGPQFQTPTIELLTKLYDHYHAIIGD